ncbi:MAG TPA: glycerophosphodiester phosphodiesterase [Gemmatimonas sp.]|nr:glycerophosphodiester phosphodiesterase [Gemmatimonas sp.]
MRSSVATMTFAALDSSTPRPLVIAHRGASGHRPEHTLEAYALAIEMGADYVEPDLVSTRDGVLVARHENEIGGTTDVATKFPGRRRTRVVDGDSVSGWFVEDFTLAEVRTLRARERLSQRNHAFDGQFGIPTFDEVLALVASKSRETRRTIGVYPETKHPSYFASIGLPLEVPLLKSLTQSGLNRKDAPVFVQSFEVENLRRLHKITTVRLIQLIDAGGGPADGGRGDTPRQYRDMLSVPALRAIAAYAYGIGVAKALVQPLTNGGALGTPTSLVADAHGAGLAVHVWTMRRDTAFLPAGYAGDATAEWRHFARLGVDGIFGDFPDDGVRARAR